MKHHLAYFGISVVVGDREHLYKTIVRHNMTAYK